MTWYIAALLALGCGAVFGVLTVVMPRRDARRAYACMWVAFVLAGWSTLMVITS